MRGSGEIHMSVFPELPCGEGRLRSPAMNPQDAALKQLHVKLAP
jgi:hypothetical protein